MYGPPECRPAAPPYECARRCATSAVARAAISHHVTYDTSDPSSSHQADGAPAPRALSSYESVARSSTRASKRDRPSRHGPSTSRTVLAGHLFRSAPGARRLAMSAARPTAWANKRERDHDDGQLAFGCIRDKARSILCVHLTYTTRRS